MPQIEKHYAYKKNMYLKIDKPMDQWTNGLTRAITMNPII